MCVVEEGCRYKCLHVYPVGYRLVVLLAPSSTGRSNSCPLAVLTRCIYEKVFLCENLVDLILPKLNFPTKQNTILQNLCFWQNCIKNRIGRTTHSFLHRTTIRNLLEIWLFWSIAVESCFFPLYESLECLPIFNLVKNYRQLNFFLNALCPVGIWDEYT